MKSELSFIQLSTSGNTDIVNITDQVTAALRDSGLMNGTATISAIGSTTGITTIEYEPGLVNTDVREMLDKIAPYGMPYKHNQTWGDDNGASHLRSMLVGTSTTIPFADGSLILGTWQQIVFIDFDTRSRNRKVAVQIMGT